MTRPRTCRTQPGDELYIILRAVHNLAKGSPLSTLREQKAFTRCGLMHHACLLYTSIHMRKEREIFSRTPAIVDVVEALGVVLFLNG